MITASEFVQKYNSFWKTHFPAMESYVRVVNSGAYDRELLEQKWNVEPDRSFLISEVGFCLAELDGTTERHFEMAADIAVRRLSGLSGIPKDIAALTVEETQIAKELAGRIVQIIRPSRSTDTTVTFYPEFAGCGALSKSYGDIVRGKTLIEIKSVDRGFRASDFRQLLTYFFQNNVSKQFDIERLMVVNPRRGISFSAQARQLIFDASGSDILEAQSRFLAAVGMGGTSR